MPSNLSSEGILSSFQSILDCQNYGKLEEPETYIQPIVNIVGGSQKRDEFITYLRSGAGGGHRKSKLDSYIVDHDSQAIAARIIRIESAQDGSATSEYQQVIMAWFVDGCLSTFKTIQDNDARRARQPSAPRTPDTLARGVPTSLDLRAQYHRYIASMNNRTMEAEFENFVQPIVTHNGRTMTTSDYMKPIGKSQEAIESLKLEVQDMLVDNQSGTVAVRIKFTGVSVRVWGNAGPSGKPVTFHEHAMYWFEGGKVSFVWATLDFDEYRQQLKESD
ncbi:hypothetical protein LCI18_012046 [Fusarium solani-melongenae]|uniref:Uncharacterized protein n=1 Tax=Fusarium solani subsp. cucurbitae TaxID=2747967 RepID=A0ACD3ZIT0_FUSSC|nr:hypothetical protein LCI18_012046 [Fusarium solani-melongenae]